MSVSPATTCAFVTTRSLPAGPAAALDPEPAGRSHHAHDAAKAGPNRRDGEDPLGRRGDVGGGAADCRQRIDASERIQDRAGRRQQLVELLEDHRPLKVAAQGDRAGRLHRQRTRNPRDPEPDARGQRRPERPVHLTQPRESQRGPSAGSDAFEPTGDQRADQQRADQREQRGVRGVGAAVEQQRAKPGAEPCAAGEPDQRQHPDDEPLRVAEDRQQHAETHDQPVEPGHAVSALPRRSSGVAGCPSCAEFGGAHGRASFTVPARKPIEK